MYSTLADSAIVIFCLGKSYGDSSKTREERGERKEKRIKSDASEEGRVYIEETGEGRS